MNNGLAQLFIISRQTRSTINLACPCSLLQVKRLICTFYKKKKDSGRKKTADNT